MFVPQLFTFQGTPEINEPFESWLCTLPALVLFELPPSHPLEGANVIAAPTEYSKPTRPLHLLEL